MKRRDERDPELPTGPTTPDDPALEDPSSDVIGLAGTLPSFTPTLTGSTVKMAAEDIPVEPPPEVPAAFGRYQVRRVLGQGAFGTVYLGYDGQLGRQVAVKTPHRTGDKFRQQFLDEARQLAQLRHPGIVTVHDVGLQDDRCYIISAYLEGESLYDWLKRRRPTWQESARIVAALADALAHAHAQRIVHRDLKPSNVILTAGDTPVLVDFGIAVSEAVAHRGLRGQLAGTPMYMSPEQAAGEGHRIDGRTDIYALGVMLYQMLTGRLPFYATTPQELLLQVLRDEPQPPRQIRPDLPRQLEPICLQAMAKDIGARYTTATDLAEELRQMLDAGATGQAAAPVEQHVDGPAGTGTGLRGQTSLSASASTATRRARAAERRRLTVVQSVCDVFDSEDIAEVLDDEEQREVLREFQDMCRTVVEGFEGTVVQATDRGLLMCFGYPLALEDAPRRAVRAALAVLDAMSEFDRRLAAERRVSLSAAVAVHNDMAVVEHQGGAGERFSLVGRLRNVVSQLAGAAPTGAVVMSDSVRRLVKDYFEHEPLGAPSAGDAYRVTRERPHLTRVDAIAATGITPLIGRDREVGLLQDRWAQAIEGMGQVVLLIGDAGLGKSRLVHELKQHVRGGDEDSRGVVIEWRCAQHHRNSSLYPASECFLRMLERGPDGETSLQALAAHLRGLGMSGKEELGVLAALMSLPLGEAAPTLDLNPQEQKDRTLDILLEWLRASSRQQPVLFIVEDLHWVDPTTLELLQRLVEGGFQDRILTLLTFRPAFETPWRSKAHQTQVALNRLTSRQVAEMMAAQLGTQHIPPHLVTQIIERTDGVPLFVEEFTIMLGESGKLRDRDGQVEISDSFSVSEIPATLQDLLMARLDRMASNIEVVQLAAAIGRELSHELLRAVSPVPGPELGDELDKLVHAGLLFRRGRPPAAQYVFKHSLLQEAAYQSMVKRKRLACHQRIAAALVEQFPEVRDGQPEIVAHHYSEAGMSLEAVTYWQRAGERAVQRCAYSEAIEHLNRGLELVRTLPESPERQQRALDIHISLGVPLQSIKGYSSPEVEENYKRAYDLCNQMGPTAQLFPVLSGLFRYFLLQARFSEAQRLGERLVALAEEDQDPHFTVAAHRALGAPLVYRGEHARALPHLHQVLSIASTPELRAEVYRYDVVDPWVASRSYLGWAMWMLGEVDDALSQVDHALALAENLDHPFSLALALSFSGWTYQFCSDVDRVEEVGQRALDISTEHSFAFWIGWNQILLGWAESARGRHREAIARIRAGMDQWRAQGSELGRHYYLGLLAEACWQAGEIDEAREALVQAHEFSRSTGEVFWKPEILRLEGELCLMRDRSAHEQAEAHYQEALALARRQQARSLALRAATSLARLWQHQGRLDEARALLDEACARFRQGLPMPELERARALLAALT